MCLMMEAGRGAALGPPPAQFLSHAPKAIYQLPSCLENSPRAAALLTLVFYMIFIVILYAVIRSF